jgi:hypothetical protein
MYLGPLFIFAGFSSLFFVPGFLDIPLAHLTFRQIISEGLSALFGFIALAAFARSVEFDPIWPWKPGFRRLMVRLGFIPGAE